MIQKLSNTSIALIFITAFLSPNAAVAGGTKLWELAGFTELDKGELKNTALSSEGVVTLGTQANRVDLKATGIVWSAARDKGGRVYLGTAYDGKIFRVDNGEAVEIAITGQLVITSLAFDKKGDLYASSLPDATIWKIPSPSKIKKGKPLKAKKWSTLTKAKNQVMHIWSLAFEKGGSTLFAATGPEGKVFAVGKDSKASVYFDSEEEHILALSSAKKGRLIAGTSPNAQLLQISGPGRASTLADFNGTEVKAVAVSGKAIFAAVNKFSKPPAIPRKPKSKAAAANGMGSKSTVSKIPKLGDGALYRLKDTGQLEKLWSKKKNHVLCIAVAGNNLLYAGLASGGRVVSVDMNRNVKSELDLDERQVMVLLAGKKLDFAAVGDTAAAYNLTDTRPSEAFYVSPPLFAGAISKWGHLNWFATGALIVQSRSGNTMTPDNSWSNWSKTIKNNGVVSSPSGSYLQLRFSWKKDPKAVLRGVELAYLPQNRRAVITKFNPETPFTTTAKSSIKIKTKSKAKKVTSSRRTVNAKPSQDNEAIIKLKWKIENPDGDSLRYKLWYRALGKTLWRPILKADEILTKPLYNWKTISVPEGRYQLKLVVDDSLSNDPRETLSDEEISIPILIDNHQPAVTKLTFAKGRLSGKAQDTFSPISGLDFSIDSGPWMPLSCKDQICDELVEEFDLKLPTDLASGPHAIAIRTLDRTGNEGIAEIHIEVR